ncbi:MAG TPA: DUF2071 domain-containing protein [Nitriliruptorales bacterium]|nr:DUF2071 domain-containing protein [Nitriliruptorales bacterium]
MTTAAVRLRRHSWWLLTGTAGMLLATVVGPQVAAPPEPDVRWTGVLLVAVLGGVTTTVVGPRLLPIAVARGRRLRPLTQGAAVGVVAAGVAAVAVSLFPALLAPVELRVGHGVPDLLLSQLQWAVPAAGVAGAVLGLAGWAVVTQRGAVLALGRLVRGAGLGAFLAWGAAAATALAALLTAAFLAEGSAGAGPVRARAAAVLVAGPWWSLGWVAWGVASLGLVAVLVLLAERVAPRWRTLVVAFAAVAVAADAVSFTLLGWALPALAGDVARSGDAAFVAVERTALALTGLAGNVVYGTVGLLLVRAAGPRGMHPLVRMTGTAAFAVAVASGIVLATAPGAVGPVASVSVGLFVAFALGLGWQAAVSRRARPVLEQRLRRAVRTLVPLHPVPFSADVQDVVVVDLLVGADRLARLLPEGLAPRQQDGRAVVRLLGGVVRRARPSALPRSLGLPATAVVVLQVDVTDRDGAPAASFLRGFAQPTLGAVATHWLTELRLARVDLRVRSTDAGWSARGSAGAVRVLLQPDADAPAARIQGAARRVTVERGARLVDVPLATDGAVARPARVQVLEVPLLQRLGAEVLGAALLGEVRVRTGRARWR